MKLLTQVSASTITQQVPLWSKINTISVVTQFALRAFFLFIGVYMLYTFLYGAYLVASAGVDSKTLDKGRNNITFGAIGSIIIVGLFVLGRIINSTLNLNIPI